MAANAARSGANVAFYSMEMSAPELLERLVVSESEVPSHKVKARTLSTSDVKRIGISMYRMNEWKFSIDETPSLSVYEVSARAKRMKQEYGLDLLIIDYLQLIIPPKADNRVQEVTQITRSLKVLSRELQIPIVALSQLSRQVEMREKGGEPRLSDLRDSGSVEQDSDQVVFLWREEPEGPLYAETMCGVSKNRHGNTGRFPMRLLKEESRFITR